MEPRRDLLLSFPVEVLSGICSYIYARDLACLWASGCKQLQEALGTRGGAKVFHLESDAIYVSKWPSLLHYLPHLTEITIIDQYLDYRPNLSTLSPVLRKLVLHFDEALPRLLDAIAEEASFAHLEVLDIVDPVTDRDVPLSRLKSLSSLSSLSLSQVAHGGSILDFVPPHLTFLEVRASHIDSLDFGFPQSLETFRGWIDECPKVGDTAGLPQGLHTFQLTTWDAKLTAIDISKLPRNLTSLRTAADFSSPRDTLAALPPLLRTFYQDTTFNCPKDLLQLLPRTLTSTNIIRSADAESVIFVPTGITQCTLLYPTPTNLPKLPPTLLHLQGFQIARAVPTPESSDRFSFPNTLKTLSGFPADLLDHHALPEGLLDLTIEQGPEKLSAARALRLPQGLESLSTRCHMEPDSLLHLPQRLKKLEADLSTILFTAEIARQLPPTLTLLKLSHIRLESPDLLSFLPSSLTTLMLSADSLDRVALSRLNTPHLRTLHLQLKHDEAGLGDAILTALPRRLLSMVYRVIDNQFEDITVVAINKLPPGLTRLSLPDSPQVLTLSTIPPHLHPNLVIQLSNTFISARKADDN